jgi:ATP adenylyltransferase
MDWLWSPWRLEYVTGAKDEDAGCVFCMAPRSPDPESLVVFEGISTFVILNLYPYNNGHLMVVPERHVPSLAALEPGELHEVAWLTQQAEIVLAEAYAPHGINVGINLGKPAGAGVLDHLHVHLVPRWNGDTNFMTVVGRTRVLPEELTMAAERLRPLFAARPAGPLAGRP